MSCSVCATTSCAQPQPRAPQTALGTAFSYQGQLKKNGSPYTGDCNFQFSLWDALSSGAQLGSTQSLNTVHVNGGSFAVTLDCVNVGYRAAVCQAIIERGLAPS